jgi:outer membrane protein assembly factor BamB
MPSSPSVRADEYGWKRKRRYEIAAFVFTLALIAAAVVVWAVAAGRGEPSQIGVRPSVSGALPSGNRAGVAAKGAEPAVAPDRKGTPPAAVPAGEFKENWPRFRGPGGMGIVPGGDWPTAWNGANGEGIVWKAEVPSSGKSSPVIWGDRIFLTGSDGKSQDVMCFDRTTGKLLWRKSAEAAREEKEDEPLDVSGDTGYAAPTPATDGTRIYAFFATGDLLAFDFKGNIVWKRNLGSPRNNYGIATSPIIHKNLVIVQFDRGSSAEDGFSAILGIDAETGAEMWRTERPVCNSWATPVCVETKNGFRLFTAANPWVICYDPALGIEQWKADVLTGDVAPSPVYADGFVYVTNQNSQVAAIRADGEGDVTKTHVAWTADKGMPDASSPISDGKYFLQAESSGLVTCYNARNGKLLWEKEFECAFWASPTLAGNTVYLPSADGSTRIFRLGDKFEDVASPGLGEGIYATPAFCDSLICMRGEKHLFCVGRK